MMGYLLKQVNDFNFKNPFATEWTIGERGQLVPNTAGKDIVPETWFCIVESDRFLYFKIDAVDPNPVSTMTGYNQPLYNEEVLELFISPDGGHGRYFEFEINHLGAVFAAWIEHGATGNKINFIAENPTETTVFATADGFSAVGRMPLSIIWQDGKPGSCGASFNVYRIKLVADGGMMLGAFSPTGRDNFHMPECFCRFG